MTGPWAFPGSRTLAAWGRQLAPYQPRAFWVAHLFLHRVEALIRCEALQPVDPVLLLALQALSLEEFQPQARASLSITTKAGSAYPLSALERRLRLGPALVGQVLRRLAADGLARSADQDWQLTPLGREAISLGGLPWQRAQRQTFTFVERLNAAGQRVSPPAYLNLPTLAGIPWQMGDEGRFDPQWLRDCLRQPEQWKRRRGLAPDLRDVLDLSSPPQRPEEANGATQEWERIILDRPERCLTALVLARGQAGDRLLGFCVNQEDWSLQQAGPLPEGWTEIWPELHTGPSADSLQGAWRDWCRTRRLPPRETASCALSFESPRLRVTAPAALVQRLHADRSDIFRGDAWLLAGEGPMRPAVQLELVEGK
jgi:hypothetical protein